MKKILLSTVLLASSWVMFAQDTTNRTNNTTTNQQMNTSTNQNNSNMNTTSDQMYNSSSTSNYNAYGIPNYVQMNFQTQYPNVNNMTWTAPTADWYHGFYFDNGRYTHVYYSTDPYYNVQYYPERVTGYTVSMPVLQTWVPDEVITTATNLYKQNLYDITALRRSNSNNMNNGSMNNSSNGTNTNGSQDVIYQVRVLDNGEMKSMWMDANGTAVTDYWRTADQNTNTATDMNSNMSTDTNAAMDNSTMNNSNTNTNANTKIKTKTKMSDGSEIKTKTKNGKTKTKHSGSSSGTTDQY